MNSQPSEGTILQDKPSLIANQLEKPKVNIPLDVTTELSQFTKFYITKGVDFFRIVCCCENLIPEYNIYGEMPDGDKKLSFTFLHVAIVDAQIVVQNIVKVLVFFVFVVAIYAQI